MLLRLADGRLLEYAVFGSLSRGAPAVVYHHGWPSMTPCHVLSRRALLFVVRSMHMHFMMPNATCTKPVWVSRYATRCQTAKP